jgi:hypothetical protein
LPEVVFQVGFRSIANFHGFDSEGSFCVRMSAECKTAFDIHHYCNGPTYEGHASGGIVALLVEHFYDSAELMLCIRQGNDL